MSFLYPLFFAALAGLAIPIFLHLARRRTRRELPFGSLRFLTASPPRFESRKRVEHWLLLALRCLAVALLAAAFARPLLTRPLPGVTAGAGRRVLILVDTSASMRRQGLWRQALDKVKAQIADVRDQDRLSVLAFDRRPRTLIRFEEWAEASPSARAALLSARLGEPGWGGTDLGAALVAAAEAMLDDENSRRTSPPMSEQTVVLISDLQQGSRLLALGSDEWPRGLRLRIDAVVGANEPNLGLAAVAEPPNQVAGEAAAAIVARVLASGEPGARARGTIRWEGKEGRGVEVDLAAGESRVVPVPGATAGTLVLSGDAHAFDNHLAIAPSVPQAVQVLYIGPDDGRDPKGALYFLQRALPSTHSRAPRVTARRPDNPALAGDLPRAHLVVLAADPPPALQPLLREHLGRGRTLLYLLTGPASAATLGGLTGGGVPPLREAPPGREAVLTDVDVAHPVLAPFGDGRFSDFTKVRFWRRRLLDARPLPGARVLARFDDGSPAWVGVPVGRGLLWVMTSGWQPADSQLALSSKFVPLLWSLLETSAGLGSGQAQFFVGDPVSLPPAFAAAEHLALRRPDGKTVALPRGTAQLTDTDQPGLYALQASGERPLIFAVNLPPSESVTALLPIESLERLGIELSQAGSASTASPSVPDRAAVAAAEGRRRGAFFIDLEARQRAWRWVLAAALVLLVAETVLASWLRRLPPVVHSGVRPGVRPGNEEVS